MQSHQGAAQHARRPTGCDQHVGFSTLIGLHRQIIGVAGAGVLLFDGARFVQAEYSL